VGERERERERERETQRERKRAAEDKYRKLSVRKVYVGQLATSIISAGFPKRHL
jgi:hypothetical protein